MVIGKGIETASAPPPVINSISADQPILDGETSVTIRADKIIALNEITRVWAVIIPPDYTHGSPDTPVTDLTTAFTTALAKEEFTRSPSMPQTSWTLIPCPGKTTVVQTKRPLGPKGDLSGNGETELEDAIIALKVLAEMTWLIWYDYATSGADVNGDDRIGLGEAVYILKSVGR